MRNSSRNLGRLGDRVPPTWLGLFLVLLPLTWIYPYWSHAQPYQQFRQLPVDKDYLDKTKLPKLKAAKANLIKQGNPAADQSKVIPSFYLKYLFPAMSREDHAEEVVSIRQQILADILTAPTPEMRKYLQDLAIQGCKGLLSQRNLHPAAHVNAILLLADLNLTEGQGTTLAPVPIPQATEMFVAILSRVEMFSEPARATALTVLERNVALRKAASGDAALKPGDIAKLRDLILPMVTVVEVPPERSPEAHEWIRIRAIRILKVLGDAGPNGEVATALMGIAADKTNSAALRSAALEALGALPAKSWEVDNEKLTFAAARTLVQLLSAELNEMMREARNYGGPTRREGLDGFGGDDPAKKYELADTRTKNPRRRLIPTLRTLELAFLGASKAGVPGLTASLDLGALEPLTTAVQKSLATAQNLTLTLEAMIDELSEIRDSLDNEFPDPEEQQRRDRRRRRDDGEFSRERFR